MTKYGLRTWVFLLTLTPTLLVGLMLGTYFSVTRFHEQEAKLTELGSNIAEPLAIAIQRDLLSNDREAVTRLIGALHRKNAPYVTSIAVYDKNNQLFSSSNFHRHYERLKMTAGEALPSVTQIVNDDDSVIVRSPIYRESSPLSVYYSQQADHNHQQIGYVVVQLDRARAQAASYSGVLASIAIIFMGMLFTLAFTIRLMRQVYTPITEMVDAIDRIRRGHLDTHINGGLIGELEVLRNGINDMARSISAYQSDMQYSIDQATADLRETLEQIEIQNVELDMAKRRAMEASRVKSEFLANMSHELRTPLNGVLGFSRQLLKGNLTPTQREQISTIEGSATNLLSIINDILDFSKLEAGKLKLEHLPFVLHDAVDEVTSLLAPSAFQKGLEFILEITPDVPPYLVGDALRVKQVLTNLIGNAIKFTDQGSVHVRVSLLGIGQGREQEMLRISVADTGIGIPAEQQKQLFQPFGQGDTSITRRFGGTGLGLIITKRLVQQMGGDVGLYSEPDKGSTFWASITCTRSPLPLGEPLPVGALQDKQVVIFERNEDYRRVLRELLESWDMHVLTLRNDTDWHNFMAKDEHYDYMLIAEDYHNETQLRSSLQQARQHADRIGFLFTDVDQPAREHLANLLDESCFIITKPIHPHYLCRKLDACSSSRLNDMPLLDDKLAEKATDPFYFSGRVLAVDDNQANLRLIATLLDDLVERVDTANNGAEAVHLANNHHYDVIFMDIQMPKMDGLSATSEIRKNEINRATPIIAVTAHALPEERSHLLAQGMDDYLTKPIEEAQLQQLISKWLAHLQRPSLKPAKASVKPAQVAADNAPSTLLIDWSLAVQQSSQRPEIAKQMLEMLIDSLPEALQQLEDAWVKGEKQAFQQHIHKLHGASCYTGTPSLRKLLNTMESMLKQSQQLYDLEPEYLELQDLISQLQQTDLSQFTAH